MPTKGDSATPHDVFIVSDLHVGSGLRKGAVRYNRLEGFFYDDVFSRFIDKIIEEQIQRERRAYLVLGGDVFDFLSMTELPNRTEARAMGIQVTRDARRFGLESTPRNTEWKLRHIAKGHPIFFEALGRFLASGHHIVIVSGNHDAELYWSRVRETATELILTQAVKLRPDLNPATARQRIEFRHWFYREDGRFYFEHGNQYEASNSFRYNLCPLQPTAKGKILKSLDPPIGSLFARYIVNETRKRTPYIMNMVSLEQYMGAMASMNLVEMIGVFVRRTPFFVKAIQKAKLFEGNAWKAIKTRHCQNLERLARKEGLPVSALKTIQHLRAMPDGMTKYHLALGMLKPVLYKIIKYFLFALAAVFVWFAVFSLIQNTPWLAASFLGKASLTALLAMLTVLVALVYLNSVLSKVRQVTVGVTPEFFEKARLIAKTANVRHVVMGHTHVADIKRFPKTRGYYINTGTWIATTGPWDLLWPNSRRYTFARVQDDDIELLRWNDQAGRFEKVRFLDDYQLSPMDVIFPDDPVRAHPTIEEQPTLDEILDHIREE